MRMWRKSDMNNPLKQTVSRVTPKESPCTSKVQYFNMLLYPEDTNYDIDNVIEKVSSDKHVSSYAYIKHDNDFYLEDTFDKMGHLLGRKGSKKKDHYHVCVAMNNRTPIADISTWLCVPQRFIEKAKSYEASILYLTHRNAPEKTPYAVTEVNTNIKEYVDYLYYNYEPKEAPIKSVLAYIDQTDNPTFSGFVNYYGVDISGELRPYWSMIRDVLNEHKNAMARLQENYRNDLEWHRVHQNGLAKLVEQFGKVSVKMDDGHTEQITLNDDGTLDFMGYTVGGNK